MEPLELPYLPGKPLAAPVPLARYLPPLNESIAPAWLAANIPGGSWILDPFGAFPPLAIETARQGYQVLVTANNPIVSFMLEVLASAPKENDLRAALADLGSARKGDERLEIHLQSLYSVECNSCHRFIQAKAFIWQKESPVPHSCQVTCPYCNFSGDQPVGSSNLERLAALGKGALHRSRALERVIGLTDPLRPHVEQALNCYQLRPLYALITMINRLEGLSLPPEREKLAKALILSACDEANTLWPHPITRHRPRQLSVPVNFRENNLWFSLEDAIDQWQSLRSPVPLTFWPELPPESGGICLYKGRLRDLPDSLPALNFKGVLTAFPRPNQAFWTLSAVWAGWLWGQEAVAPLLSALSRQRYDWSWHASALETTLESLRHQLQPGTPFLGLISEIEAPFALASLLAADQACFDLQGYALDGDPSQLQLYWVPRLSGAILSQAPITASTAESLQVYLRRCGEPASYLPLYFLSSLAAQKAGFPKEKPSTPISGGTLTTFSQLQDSIQRKITDPTLFMRYGGSAQSPEHALWWLARETPISPSLSDKIEMAIVQILLQPGEHSQAEIEAVLYKTFPGLLTPAQDLIETVLASYGQAVDGEADHWRLREEDSPTTRKQDLKQLTATLQELGEHLGFISSGSEPVTWYDSEQQIRYAFYLLASAVIGRFVFGHGSLPERSILVVPGGRVGLISYKLHNNPSLNDAIDHGWRFLKFRQLRQMAGSLFMDQSAWEELLKADPLVGTSEKQY